MLKLEVWVILALSLLWWWPPSAFWNEYDSGIMMFGENNSVHELDAGKWMGFGSGVLVTFCGSLRFLFWSP